MLKVCCPSNDESWLCTVGWISDAAIILAQVATNVEPDVQHCGDGLELGHHDQHLVRVICDEEVGGILS
jgi:hypothetical protein